MPVDSYTSGDKFVVRVKKHHINNPERIWANNYELLANGSGDEAELLDTVTKIVNFEIAFHCTPVVFDEVVVSTWEPDSVPYNPSSFLSSPLTATGNKDPVNEDVVALNVTLNVRKQVGTGRYGRNFYRCVLLENEVSAPAGIYVLTTPADIQDLIDNAVASSSIDDLLNGGTGTFALVIITNDVITPRPVVSLHVGGVSTVPVNHAWFNRSSPTP